MSTVQASKRSLYAIFHNLMSIIFSCGSIVYAMIAIAFVAGSFIAMVSVGITQLMIRTIQRVSLHMGFKSQR
ncbi:hypothetical protein [Vibrio methylphosphonaticus]|uniref:hypothetical protein n=1 Tax=Vibrio methylphosphonaticus TaxID=2946866 RepID=UPI002029B4D1|nr:hypothetical protein [Vibrio methylphosphonaticus]MCL9775629.1 hypothetical protein [Vibrio methylphosphonaticus]